MTAHWISCYLYIVQLAKKWTARDHLHAPCGFYAIDSIFGSKRVARIANCRSYIMFLNILHAALSYCKVV